jgi:pyrroline-5-carboxylate reductase
VKAAYGGTPVVRMLPSTPVEVKQGVIVHARDPEADAGLERTALELFGRVGTVVTIEDAQFNTAMGLMSCAPAYMALVAEAQVDAGVRHGLPADLAAEMVVGTMAGSAALLQQRDNDTLAMRRAVTSPGGSTAKGLAKLEEHGVRRAFEAAMEAIQ